MTSAKQESKPPDPREVRPSRSQEPRAHVLRPRRLRRAVEISLLAVLPLWAGAHSACAAKKGGLMLAINTDMKAPKDVNIVSVHIQTGSAVKHNFIGRVTPEGEVGLPATLAITEPDDPNQSIRVRVVAFQENKPRVLRDVRTTVPRDGRIALLRIPLAFVNDGISVTGSLPDKFVPPKASGGPVGSGDAGAGLGGGGEELNPYDPTTSGFTPGCADPDQTYIDGVCKDSFVDSSTLPDYTEEAVFGQGGLGNCFDAKKCFAGATPIGAAGAAPKPPTPVPDGGVGDRNLPGDLTPQADRLDLSACKITLDPGKDVSKLNLALVTKDTGECIEPGKCFIPLDQGDRGWNVESAGGGGADRPPGEGDPTTGGAVIALPAILCTLVGKGIGQIYSSVGTCNSKTAANPVCPEQGDTSRPPTTTAGLVASESFVSDFARVGGRLLVAGDAGAGLFDLESRPAARVGVNGVPGGQQRAWLVGASGVLAGVVEAGNSGSTYLLNASNGFTQATPIGPIPATPLTDFAVGATGIRVVWTFGDATRGGVYTMRTDGNVPERVDPPGNVAATAVATAPVGTTMIFGDEIGNVTGCSLAATVSCNAPQPAVPGKRIEALAIVGDGSTGGALTVRGGGVYAGTLNPPGVRLLTSDNVDPLTPADGPSLRRRIAVTSKCVYFATGNKVRWVTFDGAQQGDIATAGFPVTAVVTSESDLGVFYSVFASMSDQGGIYSAPKPSQCAGGDGSSADAGGVIPPDGGP